MVASFDMAGMDSPVYRAAGAALLVPKLARQKAFGHEQLQPA